MISKQNLILLLTFNFSIHFLKYISLLEKDLIILIAFLIIIVDSSTSLTHHGQEN
jgi:hypothetical protein